MDASQPPDGRERAGATEKSDWQAWHREYDRPDSRLSRRLRVVQQHLRRAVEGRPGRLRLISMCAGEGRDVLGVLADHPRAGDVSATLVELDPDLARIARSTAERAGLYGVDVRCGDAALTDSYAGAAPAEIVLACGIFGNISLDDIRTTAHSLPMLCSPGATVIWTRYRRPGSDATPEIRGYFADAGFEEEEFSARDDETYSVGSHRLVAAARPLIAGQRLFTFIR